MQLHSIPFPPMQPKGIPLQQLTHTAHQPREGTLYVPKPYAREVSGLLHRVADDVNLLHASSVHNKLMYAQQLAGASYYKAQNAPERQAINTMIPHVNHLKAQVIESHQPKPLTGIPVSVMAIEFTPKKGVTTTPGLRQVGKRLQHHVEGWVSQYAKTVGLPHYLKK